MLKGSKLIIFFFLLMSVFGCKPEMPITSSIEIDTGGSVVPVNNMLYGFTLEEINHAIEGGLYAELIKNRSFEDGVTPLNCAYDFSKNVLVTPNGWSIPFVRPDSVPGWHKLSFSTYMAADNRELINDKNRRSLSVTVIASQEPSRGGVVAEGYKGIPIKKGEQYHLSLYIKSAYALAETIHIALEDSLNTTALSDIFQVNPTTEWKRYSHIFTAAEDAFNSVLTIYTDSSSSFFLDVVSLFPDKTWHNQPNGLRSDLMEMLAALNPAFLRFPGGAFVEGYTAGTYPIWNETIGDIATRKHFWNIWSYGTSNGMGYHEYLQLCEELKAEPIYVVNSGLTSQSRRPRYEDITVMNKVIQDVLGAIAYANHPVDSVYGNMRAKHGHPTPFKLKYIEVGSENYGTEYTKRFELIKSAVKKVYPEVNVISSSQLVKQSRSDWVDTHVYADDKFFISNSNRFDLNYLRRHPGVFIGEFGTSSLANQGTLRAALAEACFLLGAEQNPHIVQALSYAPILGNANYENQRNPVISFNNVQAVASPSYHLLQMFANNRGSELLKTAVNTYLKPNVTPGRMGIQLFDNSYEIKDVTIDHKTVTDVSTLNGGWRVEDGRLIPDANKWNYVVMGDSLAYDCEFSAKIRRTKGSGQIEFHIRDNARGGDQSDYICMTLGTNSSELYHQSGTVKDSLSSPKTGNYESHLWYNVTIKCVDDKIACFVNDALIHKVIMPSLPSLVSVATLDKDSSTIILKVVNTTYHEERTELKIHGVSLKNEARVLQLKGVPETRNTFENPRMIVPEEKIISFPMGRSMIYNFPPNSVTILTLSVN